MLFGTKKEEKHTAAEKREHLKRHALYRVHELKGKKSSDGNIHELINIAMEFLTGYFHLHDTVTCDEIEDLLDEKHADESSRRKIGLLLETMSRVKYGDVELTNDEFHELIDETEHVIKELH